MLEPIGEDIWIGPGTTVESFGFRYPTRMAVIRLADGALFIWSPVALSPELRNDVDALGSVRFIVTPTAMHSVSLPEWKCAYPNATLFAAPGSRERRKDIAFDADLMDEPPADWDGELDQVLMRGNAIAVEAIFYHRKSGTVLIADLLQNFPAGWFTGVRSVMARLDGMIAPEPRTPQKFRIAFTNRKAARVSLGKVLAWPARKVVIAHGDIVHENARAYLARAFKWLSG